MSLSRTALRAVRSYSTASPITVKHSTSNSSGSLLGNVEVNWASRSPVERHEIYEKLAEIQKQDWKALTIDEKKAAYYVAFGAHGPRQAVNPPGHSIKILVGTLAACGAAIGIFGLIRSSAPAPPKTMTKEWQEASTEMAKEQKINPITGISSEGYAGKGFVSA
ncbi:hypothetical protein FFLO_03366 [Filobasidium floriforme]|uniref:Cytochrome c oxidase subunit IV n=1 Tax=Filobasidium floriforme TaxID=5210 RepID=A0A8K0JL45_9TREE|nr:putative cytochrome c oxidase subunit V [Filobasidium floriforme]KAG7544253.1 hypothetical protein FFLO_03366 [Filobasidium floriforme]KAH8085721.1 putative cytochrome c oxidase subunit V [Filobasidium floriforme]